MSDTLLCLNSEWQGCECRDLESGSRRLAAELFGSRRSLDIGRAGQRESATRDGVFALDSIAERCMTTLAALRREDADRVFTIGGTCGVEVAPVAYLARRYGDGLGVVWLDAHGDLNTPGSSPSGHFHGMVLRTLLGEGPREVLGCVDRRVKPENLVLAGVRDLDEAEARYVDAAGLRVVSGWPDEAATAVTGVLADAGIDHVYVHIDVDVFDPRAFDDALFSVPGGPTLEQVAETIAAIGRRFDIVGVGIVEYLGRTPDSASRLCRMLVAAGVWPPAVA